MWDIFQIWNSICIYVCVIGSIRNYRNRSSYRAMYFLVGVSFCMVYYLQLYFVVHGIIYKRLCVDCDYRIRSRARRDYIRFSGQLISHARASRCVKGGRSAYQAFTLLALRGGKCNAVYSKLFFLYGFRSSNHHHPVCRGCWNGALY